MFNGVETTVLFLVIISLSVLILAGYSALWVRFMYANRKEYEGLKGKKPDKLLMGASLILYILFLAFSVGALSFYKRQMKNWPV